MRFIALRELPKGTQPGQEFEATEDEGHVLMLVGAAKPVEDEPPSRRKYQRRDLEATSV
jgi:hypothetical protein